MNVMPELHIAQMGENFLLPFHQTYLGLDNLVKIT